jgi:uncharacterized protein YpiB (UPF0302 family)
LISLNTLCRKVPKTANLNVSFVETAEQTEETIVLTANKRNSEKAKAYWEKQIYCWNKTEKLLEFQRDLFWNIHAKNRNRTIYGLY